MRCFSFDLCKGRPSKNTIDIPVKPMKALPSRISFVVNYVFEHMFKVLDVPYLFFVQLFARNPNLRSEEKLKKRLPPRVPTSYHQNPSPHMLHRNCCIAVYDTVDGKRFPPSIFGHSSAPRSRRVINKVDMNPKGLTEVPKPFRIPTKPLDWTFIEKTRFNHLFNLINPFTGPFKALCRAIHGSLRAIGYTGSYQGGGSYFRLP